VGWRNAALAGAARSKHRNGEGRKRLVAGCPMGRRWPICPTDQRVRFGGKQHAAFNTSFTGSGRCAASTATLRLDTLRTGPRFRRALRVR